MKKNKKLSFSSLSLFVLIPLLFMVSSCIPQKRIELLQNESQADNIYQLHEKATLLIKPNDELYIRVSSFDDVAYNFFNNQTATNYMNYNNELSLSLITFNVNDSGLINFPILGYIKMAGLTIDEATMKLKESLSEYFNQPTVIIKLANKKISVLGEVRMSGSFTYTKDRINVFEALSMAGNVTTYGNLKDIYLIRSEHDSIMKIRLNLSNDKILTSEYYYLMPDDIIYVKSRPSVKWGIVSVPITLALTAITTAFLIINYQR